MFEDEIELVFPDKKHESAAMDYYREHRLNGENTLHGDSGLDCAKNYDEWLDKVKEDVDGKIHSLIFLAVRKSDEKLIGTINIRYPYEEYVKIYGHIGYGVRPSERKKGYATVMLKSALNRCKELGLKRVLITCEKSNAASVNVIIKCSGLLESEELHRDGRVLQRYWIEL